MESIIGLLVTVIVLGLVFYVLWWLIGVIGLPEPFNKVAIVLIALCAVIACSRCCSGTGASRCCGSGK